MARYPTLFLTERGLRHQQDALEAAPPELEVVILRQPAREDLFRHLSTARFLISERTGAVDASMVAAAPHLRLIVRLGSLAYDIDLEAARRQRVAVATWPVRDSIMVAEHAVMQMLALAKRLVETNGLAMAAEYWGRPRRTNEDTFAYNWTGRHDIGGLWQKTAGILGFGGIGAELARRLRGWGCTMLYHRRRRLPPAGEAEFGVSYAGFDEILEQSDFLVNLLPYSTATEHALGAAQFARMKQGTFLVSCGSGSVIDEAALAAALRSRHLGGAALDTFEWEPLVRDHPLRQLALQEPPANVLLTPHIAGGTTPGGVIASRGEDYVPILRFLAGEPLPTRLV